MEKSIKIYCHQWGNTTTFSTSPVLKYWDHSTARALKPVPRHCYSTKVVELSPAWQLLPYYYGGMTCYAFGRISPVTGAPEIAAVSGADRRLTLDQAGTLIEGLWDDGRNQWVGCPVEEGWVPISD